MKRTGTEWIVPGRRLRLSPDASVRAAKGAMAQAETVQFAEPLPSKLLDVVRSAVAERPDLELYIYGHHGLEIDQDLPFLDGFDLRSLSLNLYGLESLNSLQRFTRLQRLTLGGWAKRMDLSPLRALKSLEYLALTSPGNADHLFEALPKLRSLNMSGAQSVIDGLAHHPSLQRLRLNFGGAADLAPLSTLPSLSDLSFWQIQQLTSEHLGPVGEIKRLEALQLGALRHVEDLSFLLGVRHTLRYLELELLKGLRTFAPLAGCSELRVGVFFDSRPADRSLKPLASLASLEDLTIGDVYPTAELTHLAQALPNTRITARQQDLGAGPSTAGWRGLFAHVDKRRGESLDQPRSG